jgi:hypothetical protein
MNYIALLVFAVPLIPVALAGPLIFLGAPTEKKRPAGLVAAMLLIFLNAVGLIVVFGEIFFVASDFVLFNTIIIVTVSCVGVAVYRQHGTHIALWLHGVFLVAFLALVLMDFSPRKPYRRFFNAISPGMTRSEVMTALHRQFPPKGRYPVPVLRDEEWPFRLLFFLDPIQGAYNAEGIFLTFSNELVVSKIYSPD